MDAISKDQLITLTYLREKALPKLQRILAHDVSESYAQEVGKHVSHILSRVRSLPGSHAETILTEMRNCIDAGYKDGSTKIHLLDRLGGQSAA